MPLPSTRKSQLWTEGAASAEAGAPCLSWKPLYLLYLSALRMA